MVAHWTRRHQKAAEGMQSVAIWGSGLLGLSMVPVILSFFQPTSSEHELNTGKQLAYQLLTAIIFYVCSMWLPFVKLCHKQHLQTPVVVYR